MSGGKSKKKRRGKAVPARTHVADLIEQYAEACSGVSERPIALLQDRFVQSEAANKLVLKIVISVPLGDRQIVALSTALRHYGRLKHLCIWSAEITDLGLSALSEFIEDDKSLITFEFISNLASSAGWTAFGKAIGKNRSLVNVVLDHNEIGDRGAKHIAAGIKQNIEEGGPLRSLSFRYCRIGAVGAQSLGECVFAQKRVQIDLGQEKEKEKVVRRRVGKKSKKPPKAGVRVLNLQGNPLGAEGVSGVLVGARQSKVLEKLWLRDTAVSYRGQNVWTLLLRTLETCDGLKHIDISDNEIGEENAEALFAAVKAKGNVMTCNVPVRVSAKLYKRFQDMTRKGRKKGRRRGAKSPAPPAIITSSVSASAYNALLEPPEPVPTTIGGQGQYHDMDSRPVSITMSETSTEPEPSISPAPASSVPSTMDISIGETNAMVVDGVKPVTVPMPVEHERKEYVTEVSLVPFN